MSIYRYTQQGVDELMRKAAVTMAAMPMVIIAVAIGVTWLGKRGKPMNAADVVPFAILTPFLFWTFWRQRGKTRSLILSTEVEFIGDELVVRNAQVAVALRRQEIREMRRFNGGLLIRGQGFSKRVLLNRGLENFDVLAREVDEWVPTEVVRSTGSETTRIWVWGLAVAIFALLVTAFVVQDPIVAGGASILAAVVLAACTVPAWRKRSDIQVDPKLRRSSLLVLFPIAVLLWRAVSIFAR